MRKSFATFVKKASKYTIKFLVNRCQILGCQLQFLKDTV